MEIYLEYAVIENFLVDGSLLYLALSASKQKISWLRLCSASVCGAAFAVLFPLLRLPEFLVYTLKFSVGALLCIIAVKPRKQGGRVGLTLLLFYAFSFCLGGGLIAVFEAFSLDYALSSGGGVLSQVPVGGLLLCVAAFVALVKLGVKKLYQKRCQQADIYPCELVRGSKKIKVDGFFDTGNTAKYQGLPVCFLSPEIFYDLFGMEEPIGEMDILTMAGEKRIRLYRLDELKVYIKGGESISLQANISPALQIKDRPYKILLPSIEY
ncbi:MAG: sigma-E processing peptidase SpoIIGA [Clostridia bacterium]|nr:sigma-E processing peptidase SpoIIGA [Clostridia bacterium]